MNWSGHGITSVPRRVAVQNVPRPSVPQPVPVSHATFIGPSAYDIAVTHGFVGTETKWLAANDGTTAINAHIENPRPHVNAESGRDFAGWFTAAIT